MEKLNTLKKTSPQEPLGSPRKRSRSLVYDVMDDIRAKIFRGQYQPGDQLPTEPVLMNEQGVSRTVVREAISRLQAASFVETRHGVGTFVLPFPPAEVELPLKTRAETPLKMSLDLATVATLRDVLAMLELRISLETEAAGLAAMRRHPEQLQLMRQALQSFEEGLLRGDSCVQADHQFHLQIALATQNNYFADFYRQLGTATIPRTRLDTSQFSAEPGQSYLYRTNREHEDILAAIARQDAQAARAAMRMHLSNSRERLRRASEETDKNVPHAQHVANSTGTKHN